MIPLDRLGKGTDTDTHNLFHFVLTPHSDPFDLRAQRAIEAVLFHHPNAKVILHSRVPTEEAVMEMLWESGYNVESRTYTFEGLLNGSSAIDSGDLSKLLQSLSDLRRGRYWEFFQTDLVRMLILERFGGVYLDTDMHVIKPFSSEIKNLVAWQDMSRSYISGAAMIFEKGNKFLRTCLRRGLQLLLNEEQHQEQDYYGLDEILSSTHRDWAKYSKGEVTEFVDVATHHVFYPYHHTNVAECFQCNSGLESPFDVNTLAVHLDTKVSSTFNVQQDSVCSQLLSDSCIFCDDMIPQTPCTIDQ
jgi:hypothetical protein